MSDFDRFVRYLVEILQARSPESVHRPVAIDDLRRTVLPYRVHRNGLGLVSAEDYETLLLRLAAEEGGYSRTFPPEAAERCRAEVATAIPDLALLDELAEVTIAIEPAAVSTLMTMEDEAPPFMPEAGPELPLLYEPGSESESDTNPGPVAGVPGKFPGPVPPEPRPAEPGPTAGPPAGLPHAPGAARLADRFAPPSPPSPQARSESVRPPSPPASVPPTASGPVPPIPPVPASPAGPAAVSPAAKHDASVPSVTRCRFCAAALPSGRSVVFCPFCGHQLAVSRCPRCDTELEPGWRHCISCGLAMAPSGTGG